MRFVCICTSWWCTFGSVTNSLALLKLKCVTAQKKQQFYVLLHSFKGLYLPGNAVYYSTCIFNFSILPEKNLWKMTFLERYCSETIRNRRYCAKNPARRTVLLAPLIDPVIFSSPWLAFCASPSTLIFTLKKCISALQKLYWIPLCQKTRRCKTMRML